MSDVVGGTGSTWGSARRERPRRVVVMRHAEHRGGVIGPSGERQIADVVRALAEWCHLSGSRVDTFEAFTVDAHLGGEVVATAALVRTHYRRAMRSFARRSGTERRPWDYCDRVRPTYAPSPSATEEPVHLVVVNEPQAGQLVHAFSGATIALRRAELVLLEARRFALPGRPTHRAVWTMAPSVPSAPSGDPLLAPVQEKIASKMRAAGVLGGLITSLLTFVLTRLFTDSIRWGDAAFASLVALSSSCALFFVAMFFYDSLTMPSQFWAPRSRRRFAGVVPSSSARWLLARPPSATSRVLQLNMVRIWSWVFRPAVVALGVGIGALFLALDEPSTAASAAAPTAATQPAGPDAVVDPNTTIDGTSIASPAGSVDLGRGHLEVAALAVVVIAGWSWWFRPRIGTSD